MTAESYRPDENDAAPPFTLPAEPVGDVSLKDFAGSYLVVFFYPKDNTPGCTQEAKAFSDLQAQFDAEGAKLLGVSADSLKKHANFREKYDLSVPLASDEQLDMLKAYGVWVEKKMYGKTFMGIERTTVLIDPEGQIRKIWRKVKVNGHAEAVLETFRALKTG